MGNGNTGVGNESSTRKPAQEQMAGAMSQQATYVMGDNECAQQKLVRLVGCRDSKARPGVTSRVKQFGQTGS
ncbi:hypothetical protein [Bradyrhizobium semiaridum]|uniref:hypothetical protein n=1 Tax=Bradyrhizobium semiaridum TaxID=2821404 RepID=UPI001CE3369D|nr:hypothetical protein [Bradyrhizobium semiaridum]